MVVFLCRIRLLSGYLNQDYLMCRLDFEPATHIEIEDKLFGAAKKSVSMSHCRSMISFANVYELAKFSTGETQYIIACSVTAYACSGRVIAVRIYGPRLRIILYMWALILSGRQSRY